MSNSLVYSDTNNAGSTCIGAVKSLSAGSTHARRVCTSREAGAFRASSAGGGETTASTSTHALITAAIISADATMPLASASPGNGGRAEARAALRVIAIEIEAFAFVAGHGALLPFGGGLGPAAS